MKAKRNHQIITVLDFSNGVVHIGQIHNNMDVYDYLKNNSFNEDEVSFMLTDHLTIKLENL